MLENKEIKGRDWIEIEYIELHIYTPTTTEINREITCIYRFWKAYDR